MSELRHSDMQNFIEELRIAKDNLCDENARLRNRISVLERDVARLTKKLRRLGDETMGMAT
jgi:polyhydroxyalkanoate synthesis regulator phasin